MGVERGNDAGGEAMGRGRRRRQPDLFDLIGPILGLIFICGIFGSLLFGPLFLKAITQLVVFVVLVCGVVALIVFLAIRSKHGQSGLVPPRGSSEEPLAHLSLDNAPRSGEKPT